MSADQQPVANGTAASDAADKKAESDDNYVWNFAYGANLSPKVLTGRRRIKPVESLATYVPGWQLLFNQRGIPGVGEWVFGNVAPANFKGAEVHGVCHKMTKEDYVRLLRSEGGGGFSDVPGYKSVPVKALTYDGKEINAFTLSSNNLKEGYYPSARYLDLLRTGGRYHKLNEEYLSWLDTYPAAPRAVWGKVLFLLLFLLLSPIGILVLVTFLCFRRTKFSHWVGYYFVELLWALFYIPVQLSQCCCERFVEVKPFIRSGPIAPVTAAAAAAAAATAAPSDQQAAQ